jgi:hypothetical protein
VLSASTATPLASTPSIGSPTLGPSMTMTSLTPATLRASLSSIVSIPPSRCGQRSITANKVLVK